MVAEGLKIVPIGDYEEMAGNLTFDSIDMSNYHKACLIFQFHALGTATSTMTIYSGAANAGMDSAVTVNYAWGGAAQGTATAGSATSCDVLSAWTSAASIAITYTTYANFTLVVEVDASAMDVANGEKFLTAYIPRSGSATGKVTAFAILTPRYAANRSATALA
jgi:hypothetical protein